MLEALIVAISVASVTAVLSGVGWLIKRAINKKVDEVEQKNSEEHAANAVRTEANKELLTIQGDLLRTINEAVDNLTAAVMVQTTLQHATQATIEARAANSDVIHDQLLQRLSELEKHDAEHHTTQPS